MAQGTLLSLNVDLTRIENAETRRALRALTQQMQQIIDSQQVEIDALLEMLLEKHIGSAGEFKHHAQKLAERIAERQRLHAIVAVAAHTPARTADPAALEAATADMEDCEPQRQVYRL